MPQFGFQKISILGLEFPIYRLNFLSENSVNSEVFSIKIGKGLCSENLPVICASFVSIITVL